MKVVFDKCSNALDYANKTKSFGLFYSTENSLNPNIHTHECCEILLLKEGGSSFLIDGKVYDATDGSLFFMNQYEAHKITFCAEKNIERWVLQIHPEFMINHSTNNTNIAKCFYMKQSNKIQLDDKDFARITECFEGLSKEYEFADDIIKQNLVIKLLVDLNILTQNNDASYESASNSYPSSLKLAIDYINSNFQNDITLSDIAKNSYISVNHLCRLFKDFLGTTASKYIISKRISEAKKYLKQGKSVAETMEKCGFNDYSNFIRTFSRKVGVSPGKYHKTYMSE